MWAMRATCVLLVVQVHAHVRRVQGMKLQVNNIRRLINKANTLITRVTYLQ
jgi:hypothetical protein